MPQWVSLDKIHFHPGQKKLSRDKVTRFQRELEETGETFPVVLHELEDGTFVLREGRHRVAAQLIAGFREVWAEIV